MKKLLLLFIISVFALKQSPAQLQGQQRIDSLLGQLPKAQEDTNKVKLLIDLSHSFYSINPDEGLNYGNKALAVAEKLNWKKGMANACRTIAGNYGYGKSDYPKALEYDAKALEWFRETGDKTGTARILGDMGVVYWYQSNYPEALKNYFDALRINEELSNKADMAATLCNIGIVYNSQRDYQKALEYISRANKIDEASGNKSGIAANLGDIGELYHNLSDNQKALEYESKSLQLYEELGDKNGVARNLGNIGILHSEQKDYNKALACFLPALQLSKDLGLQIGVATNLANIGAAWLAMAKDTTGAARKTILLQKAKVYTDSALTIFKEIGDLTSLSANYQRLSDIQMLLGDHKSSLQSYKNYVVFKDSVFNMEKDKKLTETAMQYAFDKREAAAKAAQEKKDIRQRNIRNSFIAGAAILLLLLIALINRYRYKQKANEKLTTAYDNLKKTQEELVQSEKMAAFGVMAKRMAHEIQNPLNFVNNFSEVSKELVQEIVSTGDEEEKKESAQFLMSNLEKINEHGKRASKIIDELQQRARAGTAQEFFEEDKAAPF
ncbi:MAG: tetratricopeptide repeat protein [Ginsengibacter sp.]